MNVWAVILCGGKSSRMKIDVNKTLLPLQDGVPAFMHPVRAFAPFVNGMVLVTGREERPQFMRNMAQASLPFPVLYTDGGKERQHSVQNALSVLPGECEAVLIHDGARCFVEEDVIRNVLEGIRTHGSGVAAIPSRDTVKRADQDENVLETLRRDELKVIQTPQGFFLKDLKRAFELCGDRPVTDDASVMEAAGFPVHLTRGSEKNIKLTYREDLKMTNAALPRVGQGYDAHRLVNGRELVLCGVTIPYEKGLLGHSDADVAVHALMDAMLGAAALGDIGALFPDKDPAYEGISSLVLLERVCTLLFEKGYVVGNADITILAQQPKLMPYIYKMRETLSDTMKIGVDQVSVKATTTEKMGFEGRGEGVSALAAVVLYRQ